ncbi:MAG: hypothetical protein EBS01_15270, partial [Verrucomicrobia bacterium]|nr:hypothetical protein [Verrucomicrobiota bacterium]
MPESSPENPSLTAQNISATEAGRPAAKADELRRFKETGDLEGYSSLALHLATQPVGSENDCAQISEALSTAGHPLEAVSFLER